MENLYSTIFIVDISQNPDEVDTVASRIQQLIEDHGGIIKKIDRWGKRRLSYMIDKKTYGFYVEIEFSANRHLNIPKTLEEEFRLNDRVLRHLTYAIDKTELIQRAKIAAKYAAKAEQENKPEAPSAPEPKPAVKQEPKPAATEEVKPDTTEEAKPDTTEEAKPDTTEEAKPDTTEEAKPEEAPVEAQETAGSDEETKTEEPKA